MTEWRHIMTLMKDAPGFAVAANAVADGDTEKAEATKAKAGKAKMKGKQLVKPVETPPAPELAKPVSPEVSKMSLKDRLLAARGDFDPAALAAEIKEKGEVLATPEIVAMFAEIVEGADRLAKLLDYDGDSRGWYNATYEQAKAQLRKWMGQGQSVAGELLEQFAGFEEGKVQITDLLWRVVQMFARPTRTIKSYRDLGVFLERLVGRGLAKKVTNRQSRTVAVGPTLFLPANGKMPDLGWAFVRRVEARLKQDNLAFRHDKFANLREQAKPGFTPKMAEDGEEGSVFLIVNEEQGRGALVLVKTNGDEKFGVRFLGSVGVGATRDWIDFYAGRSSWPDDKLYDAFEKWRDSA